MVYVQKYIFQNQDFDASSETSIAYTKSLEIL
jgi:hypothetical protein